MTLPNSVSAGILHKVAKNGELTALKLEHILLLVLGIGILAFGGKAYDAAPEVPKVILLVIYLGSLLGIAPIAMPAFKSRFWQVVFAGIISAVLDSFIVLLQALRLRTVEAGQNRSEILHLSAKEVQETEGQRAALLALLTIAAIIGGIVIWFGEVYAAGVYLNDHRTGILSALYIVPPVAAFLCLLGVYAQKFLKIEVIPNRAIGFGRRNLAEFIVGIAALLFFHNPALCLGGLLIYAVLTRQDDRLIHVWRFETEVNVMIVLVIAWVAGGWLVTNAIEPLGLHEGIWKPIIPAGVQAVLWGPLYQDPTVNFWIRIVTISTGALLLPISSLVGVMLFRTPKQWLVYCRYSVAAAVVWYGTAMSWVYLTYNTPIGEFLEQWAHVGTAH